MQTKYYKKPIKLFIGTNPCTIFGFYFPQTSPTVGCLTLSTVYTFTSVSAAVVPLLTPECSRRARPDATDRPPGTARGSPLHRRRRRAGIPMVGTRVSRQQHCCDVGDSGELLQQRVLACSLSVLATPGRLCRRIPTNR